MCVQEQEWGEGRQTKAASLFHVQGSRIPLYHRASEWHKDSFCIQRIAFFFFSFLCKNENRENLFILKLLHTLQEQRNLLCLPGLRAWKIYAVIFFFFFCIPGFRVFPACSLQMIPEENNRLPLFFLHCLIARTLKWTWSFPSLKNQRTVLRNSMFWPQENNFMFLQSCSKN